MSFDTKILCPFCGHDYVHQRGIDIRQDGDYPYGSAYRQGHFTIGFYCEEKPNEHQWTYTYGFHKGNCYFEIKKNEDPDLLFYGNRVTGDIFE